MVEPSRDGDSGEGILGSGTTVRESVDGDWNMRSMCEEWQTFHPGMEPGLDK